MSTEISANRLLNAIEYSLANFNSLSGLLTRGHLKRWKNELFEQENALGYIGSMNFNLLSLLCWSGLSSDDWVSLRAQNILAQLSRYIQAFPFLLNNRSFKKKITNLEGVNFFSVMSELALAHQFYKSGYFVRFETKFKRNDRNDQKDVDITVVKEASLFHFEVYMPHQKFDQSENEAGEFQSLFMDFSSDNKKFTDRIVTKEMNKFGIEGFSGLNGMCFLAVNQIFFEPVYIQSALGIPTDFYFKKVLSLASGIDGLLIFEDDFSSECSFSFKNLFLKQHD